MDRDGGVGGWMNGWTDGWTEGREREERQTQGWPRKGRKPPGPALVHNAFSEDTREVFKGMAVGDQCVVTLSGQPADHDPLLLRPAWLSLGNTPPTPSAHWFQAQVGIRKSRGWG
jgi:hypothetical protein